MSSKRFTLSSVSIFKDLPFEALQRLEDRLQLISVPRGELVVTQGETADALFVVVSGRFAVEVDGQPCPIAEISRGATIGEIAFFAGGNRTATVRAARDGIVVRLTRADFDAISETSSTVLSAITASLAERLAAETRRNAAANNRLRAVPVRPRTIAIVGATSGFIPPSFIIALIAVAQARPDTLVVTSRTIAEIVGDQCVTDLEFTDALNSLESRFGTIVFIADPQLTAWSEKSIRQADEVLIVASSPGAPVEAPVPLGSLEMFALTMHPPSSRRPR
jgi:NTE family protein